MQQYGFRKGINVWDAHLDITYNAHLAFDTGWESRIISLHFSSAFDQVNHGGLLFQLTIRILELVATSMILYLIF